MKIVDKKKKLVDSWNRYRKKVDVAGVIPAQLFLDAYVRGYRQARKEGLFYK
jgi:hypothetical protein